MIAENIEGDQKIIARDVWSVTQWSSVIIIFAFYLFEIFFYLSPLSLSLSRTVLQRLRRASMAIKVYGSSLSPAVKRVLLCLAEKDLEHELVMVDLSAGQHKKEPFISLNPFGQIPAFEDGDLKLFESRAITKYIANAYSHKGTPLISEDPKKMAIIEVWLEVEAQKFDAAGHKLTWEILVKPWKGLEADEAIVEEQQGQLATVLDVYEARLAKFKYLAGDEFSLADLHHVPTINNLSKTKVKALFDARPRVSAWAADLQARPSWQKVLAAA